MSPAFAVWITGLPASGKSTIARALKGELSSRGVNVAALESDVLRPVLTPKATYSEEDRVAFYHAFNYVGTLLVSHGVPVIFDATANRRAYRAEARTTIDRFLEVSVDCPLDVCMRRDPKGLYRKAQSGEVTSMPGVQAIYEPPEHPDVIVSGDAESPEGAALAIVKLLEARGYI
jgi:adenylylsulfate kinase